MATENVTIAVPHDTYQASQLLVKFVKEVQGALSNGWQFGDDMPTVLSATMADLVPALQKINAVAADCKGDLKPFLDAVLLSAVDLAMALMGK